MSAITPDLYNDSARPHILTKVTFLKHFTLEVWASICLNKRLPEVPEYAEMRHDMMMSVKHNIDVT